MFGIKKPTGRSILAREGARVAMDDHSKDFTQAWVGDDKQSRPTHVSDYHTFLEHLSLK